MAANERFIGDVTIAPLRTDQVPQLASLINQINAHYGDPIQASDVLRTQINAALFGDPPKAHCLVAEVGEQVVGMASYNFIWPALGGESGMYLKELYVDEHWRGAGIGGLLVKGVCEVVIEEGCTRFEVATDQCNSGAQRFYERLGLPVNDAPTVRYRVEGADGIDRIIREILGGLRGS